MSEYRGYVYDIQWYVWTRWWTRKIWIFIEGCERHASTWNRMMMHIMILELWRYTLTSVSWIFTRIHKPLYGNASVNICIYSRCFWLNCLPTSIKYRYSVFIYLYNTRFNWKCESLQNHFFTWYYFCFCWNYTSESSW